MFWKGSLRPWYDQFYFCHDAVIFLVTKQCVEIMIKFDTFSFNMTKVLCILSCHTYTFRVSVISWQNSFLHLIISQIYFQSFSYNMTEQFYTSYHITNILSKYQLQHDQKILYVLLYHIFVLHLLVILHSLVCYLTCHIALNVMLFHMVMLFMLRHLFYLSCEYSTFFWVLWRVIQIYITELVHRI